MAEANSLALLQTFLAVSGALGGVALTQFFAAREKSHAFRREWVKSEFEQRTTLYNEIIAKAYSLSSVLGEVALAAKSGEQPEGEYAKSLISRMETAADALKGALASRTLNCSPAMRKIFDDTITEMTPLGDDPADVEAGAYSGRLKDLMVACTERLEAQARLEVSLEAVASRLRVKL